jgi:tripartite-type tricarboxylate transporter receptor subunit TctC
MIRKTFSATLLAAVTLGLSHAPAQAEWEPDRPISVVIAFAAGGGGDIIVRTMATLLQQELGQPVNVINRPGAGGLTGTLEMARAAPDGYNIGFAGTNLNFHGWQQPGSVTPDDFIPLALVNADAAGFQVAANSPFQTLAEAMDAFKADPASFTSSASGVGGVWHVGLLELAMAQGMEPADIVFVPTGGAAPSINELIAGGVDFAPTSVVEAAAQIKAGQVRSLGVMAEERLEAFPDVPTVSEALGQDIFHYGWRGFVAPLGTPDDVVARWKDAIRTVYESDEFKNQMNTLGFGMRWAEGDDFAAFMKAEYDDAGVILKSAGLIE